MLVVIYFKVLFFIWLFFSSTAIKVVFTIFLTLVTLLILSSHYILSKRLKIVELIFKIQIIYKSNIETIQDEIIAQFEKFKDSESDTISLEATKDLVLDIYKKYLRTDELDNFSQSLLYLLDL